MEDCDIIAMHRRKFKSPGSTRTQLQVNYSFKFSIDAEEQNTEVRLSEVSTSKRFAPYFFDGGKSVKKRKISDLEEESVYVNEKRHHEKCHDGHEHVEKVVVGESVEKKSINTEIESSPSNLSFSSSIRISPNEIMKRKRFGKGKFAKLITTTSEISIKGGKVTTFLETNLKNSIDFFSHPSSSESTSSEYERYIKSKKSSSSSFDEESKKIKDIWNIEESEERKQIKEFWLSLSEDERNRLIKEEKESVLKKMKDQQRHSSCSCPVCGKKRSDIEEELELLYNAYYEELERYAETGKLSLVLKEGPLAIKDEFVSASITTKGGKKFLEMMETLLRCTNDVSTQRAIRRKFETSTKHCEADDLDDTERLEEGKKMFQMFAAKMFEQRVLTAYRQELALEKQRKLLEEEEAREKAEKVKLENKQRKKDQQKRKKIQKKIIPQSPTKKSNQSQKSNQKQNSNAQKQNNSSGKGNSTNQNTKNNQTQNQKNVKNAQNTQNQQKNNQKNTQNQQKNNQNVSQKKGNNQNQQKTNQKNVQNQQKSNQNQQNAQNQQKNQNQKNTQNQQKSNQNQPKSNQNQTNPVKQSTPEKKLEPIAQPQNTEVKVEKKETVNQRGKKGKKRRRKKVKQVRNSFFPGSNLEDASTIPSEKPNPVPEKIIEKEVAALQQEKQEVKKEEIIPGLIQNNPGVVTRDENTPITRKKSESQLIHDNVKSPTTPTKITQQETILEKVDVKSKPLDPSPLISTSQPTFQTPTKLNSSTGAPSDYPNLIGRYNVQNIQEYTPQEGIPKLETQSSNHQSQSAKPASKLSQSNGANQNSQTVKSPSNLSNSTGALYTKSWDNLSGTEEGKSFSIISTVNTSFEEKEISHLLGMRKKSRYQIKKKIHSSKDPKIIIADKRIGVGIDTSTKIRRIFHIIRRKIANKAQYPLDFRILISLMKAEDATLELSNVSTVIYEMEKLGYVQTDKNRKEPNILNLSSELAECECCSVEKANIQFPCGHSLCTACFQNLDQPIGPFAQGQCPFCSNTITEHYRMLSNGEIIEQSNSPINKWNPLSDNISMDTSYEHSSSIFHNNPFGFFSLN